MNAHALKDAVLAAALLAALAACDGTTPPVRQTPVTAPQSHTKSAPQRHARKQLVSGYLYVPNFFGNTVTTYVPGNTTPSQTIAWGIDEPSELTFDTNGNLYVANMGSNTVSVYSGSAGSRTWTQTISQNLDSPQAIAFDPVNGDIYVANYFGSGSGCGGYGCGSVTVYSTSGTYLATITNGIDEPQAISLDSSGNVYVANSYSHYVHVYSPQTNQLLLTITKGVSDPTYPDAVAFDSSNNVYVGNATANDVTVYADGSGSISRTVSQGIVHPDGIAVDGSNNLYVGNDGPSGSSGYVTVYPAGSGSEEKKITSSIDDIEAITIGPFGYLFVSNLGPNKGSVTWYAPGTGNLQGTITTGIDGPGPLAFGP